jgi:signal transduction histidine kinase
MTDQGATTPAPVSLGELAERARGEVRALGDELGEIEMLVAQARTEAARHETRRMQATQKLAAAGELKAKEVGELQGQLVTLTRRAAVMEAQVDVLEGKARALARYRDGLSAYADALSLLAGGGGAGEAVTPEAGGVASGGAVGEAAGEAVPGAEGEPSGVAADADGTGGGAADGPALSRVVLSAQEDLRREIARAMHDGPAQSLTNIVLQAQIVDRLLQRDPDKARGELGQLVAMVQQTLDATKSFIFDVRPMVLDDLGLVPTLRRATRERGRRAQVPVSFESDGMDRRLPVDLESGLFRIVDEALAVYLERHPDRVAVTMAWDPELIIEVVARRDAPPPPQEPAEAPAPPAEDLPPALAAMIEDRREEAKPVPLAPINLPAVSWRDIQGRASAIAVGAELLDTGSRLRLVVPLPEVP